MTECEACENEIEKGEICWLRGGVIEPPARLCTPCVQATEEQYVNDRVRRNRNARKERPGGEFRMQGSSNSAPVDTLPEYKPEFYTVHWDCPVNWGKARVQVTDSLKAAQEHAAMLKRSQQGNNIRIARFTGSWIE